MRNLHEGCKRRRTLRVLGLCVGCGCPAGGTTFCTACEPKNRKPARVIALAEQEERRRKSHELRHHEPYENKLKRLERQDWRCANPGCRTTYPGEKGWHTDHDHETGLIRGELCNRCNRALGLVSDNPKILAGLIGYLEPPVT